MLQMEYMEVKKLSVNKWKNPKPTKMASITKIISATLLMITPLWIILKTMPTPILTITAVLIETAMYMSIPKLRGEIAQPKQRFITSTIILGDISIGVSTIPFMIPSGVLTASSIEVFIDPTGV